MSFSFAPPESSYGEGRTDRERLRVGPMDIDNTGDGSWLTPKRAADQEHTRKRRHVTEEEEPAAMGPPVKPPVFGNAPFVFSLPGPVDEPAKSAAGWEAASVGRRSTDDQPISPNAMRRVMARRSRQQASSRENSTERRLELSPMVSDQRHLRRRQRKQRMEQQQRRRQHQHGQQDASQQDPNQPAAASSAWTTDSESESEEEEEVTPRQSQRRSADSRRSARQRRQWRMSHGVDKMLAMMGSRVDEPTTIEKLQMHRDIPYVISGYLQLAFNIFMVGMVLVIMVNVVLTIQRDVNAKVQEYSAEILHEIAACSKQYLDNRCDPLMRVPAMEQACIAWDNCMHKDPTKVGRAKVSAETLAEIINGFIEPISLKTMLFFVTMFFGTLFISNFAFGAYRHSRVYYQSVHQSNDAPRYRPRYEEYYRRADDPMATPSPRPPTQSTVLVPNTASSTARHVKRSGRARRDPSAPSSADRRRLPPHPNI
ncbi:hypothetical protein GGF46_003429 [Coemansia sp. RSA 552]|nr:hypothetical protein GGF46_003429 [Coemansia sp. RSA 552]